MTIAQASRVSGVPRATIQRNIERGILSAYESEDGLQIRPCEFLDYCLSRYGKLIWGRPVMMFSPDVIRSNIESLLDD